MKHALNAMDDEWPRIAKCPDHALHSEQLVAIPRDDLAEARR
jgi:hypothetical protein